LPSDQHRPRLYFLAQRVPFPPDRGDKITTYNEVVHLARGYEVHVFCTADGAEDLANVAGLRPLVASVTAEPVHSLRAKLRGLLGLATGEALSVAMIGEPGLQRAIAEAAAREPPDLIFIYSSNMAQFAERFAGLPRIMQFADLDSMKWERYAAAAKWPMRWIYAREARLLRALEHRLAHACDHSLVCTDNERADFEARIPGAPVSTAANGVDLDYFRSEGATKVPGLLVFTGVMDYLPNVDAVTWFATDILPLVRRAVPEAKFVICGSRPNAAVQALAARPGVTVTGRVPDVRPFLDRAEVFVAPLRIARGIQNKVLEAMAMNLPVVATGQVWRGTGFPEGEGIRAADDPKIFADEVVALLHDGNRRTEFGRIARAAVERDFAWAAKLKTVDRVVAEALARRRGLAG
jgi:sugar transferase (PEP-CTERM/EpsH1 system associated)